MPSNRLVVVEQIYFQEDGRQPVYVESNFAIELKSDEQHYGPRFMKVGTEWMKVDTGWLSASSLIIIKCEYPRYNVIPDAEQKEIDNLTVLELGVGIGVSIDRDVVHALCHISMGRSVRIPCPKLDSLFIRSNYPTRAVVTAFPE